MSCPTILCLFVKPPIPGRVKTRLARDLGNQQACVIYVQLVEQILHQIQVSGLPLALFFDGDDQELLPLSWRSAAAVCCKQIGNDLGERMATAFRHLFDAGYQSVMLCGSDIVGIDAEYLHQAAEKLEQSGMVIAPAHDGGYCLIGFSTELFNPLVFEGILWSTEQVLLQTLKRCEQAGLKPVMLETLRDLDTLDDLKVVTKGEMSFI
ncbi:MAG: TIGR04282 family arsenosugar biosynthesis glycosyltransferase [Geobacteraceae bacterium]|nr:TIGR04282 family arsenosugar biosynthesis glycosyltransferase [Geobacteraceae bacterium]